MRKEGEEGTVGWGNAGWGTTVLQDVILMIKNMKELYIYLNIMSTFNKWHPGVDSLVMAALGDCNQNLWFHYYFFNLL